MHRIKAIFAALLTSVLLVAMIAMPASAQQTGLVNVNVENTDIVLQLPIAIAANVCDVDVNVLAADLADDGDATCTADADAVAQFTGRDRGQGPPQ